MKPTDCEFYKTMVRRLSKKKADKISKCVADLLKCRIEPHINDPDYCNAFGIMQGVAYALGYSSSCVTTDPTMPGYWFDTVINEVRKK
jgi:hypothetical protein